jgi:hypothetical protein
MHDRWLIARWLVNQQSMYLFEPVADAVLKT